MNSGQLSRMAQKWGESEKSDGEDGLGCEKRKTQKRRWVENMLYAVDSSSDPVALHQWAEAFGDQLSYLCGLLNTMNLD